MLNETSHSCAPVHARTTNRNLRAAARTAAKSAYSATDVEEETYSRYSENYEEPYQDEQRILRAVEEAAYEVSRKAKEAGIGVYDHHVTVLEVFTMVRLAAEAAAAKAAGYESWAAFEADRAARRVGAIG